MNWYLILLTIFLAPCLWTSASIASNYIIARRINFPIIVSPVSTLNPFWIILYRIFPPILLLKHLPFGLGTWARCTYMGWQFDDKHTLHSLLGPIFTIVTPAGNEVIVSDPSAAHAILAKRKDFIKPAIMYDQMNVFGPNVNTVEGEDWQRQRKLTAPQFNERISEKVWEETICQAGEMVKEWVSAGDEGTNEVAMDTATVALHVLTAVGFGVKYSFHGGLGEVHDGKAHMMSYREALQICLKNIITFSILSKKTLEISWLPKGLRKVGQAAREFQEYMNELLVLEKAKVGHDVNLVSALVHAEDVDNVGNKKNVVANVNLREDEIFGNIFAFNLAGHETTANTVAAAIVLLAVNAKYQQWLSEEIDKVGPAAGSYRICFPKLQRCLAVMVSYELHNTPALTPSPNYFLSMKPYDSTAPSCSYLKRQDPTPRPSCLRHKLTSCPLEHLLSSMSKRFIPMRRHGVMMP